MTSAWPAEKKCLWDVGPLVPNPRNSVITECSFFCFLVSRVSGIMSDFSFHSMPFVHWFMQSKNEYGTGWFSHFTVPSPKRIYFRWAWDQPSRRPRVNKQERSGSCYLFDWSITVKDCRIVWLFSFIILINFHLFRNGKNRLHGVLEGVSSFLGEWP